MMTPTILPPGGQKIGVQGLPRYSRYRGIARRGTRRRHCRLDVRKYSFSQRTINVWNKLSTDCVHATSVNVFKNRIDKYLVKAGYT